MLVETSCSVSTYAAVRWNGAACRLEAQDSYGGWFPLDQTMPIPHDLWEAVSYVREIKTRDANLANLRAKYPALNKALDHAELIQVICEAEESKTSGESSC